MEALIPLINVALTIRLVDQIRVSQLRCRVADACRFQQIAAVGRLRIREAEHGLEPQQAC